MMPMGKEARTTTLKKVLKIAGDVLLFALVAIALFVVVVSISSKKDEDGTATVFGIQLRFVQSDSMAECELTDVSQYKIKSIPVKSCIFVEVVPEEDEQRAEWLENVQIGDVLTIKYVYTKQETITHRVVAKEDNGKGGYYVTVQGDNKNSDSNLLSQTVDTSIAESPNYIVGKVVGQSYLLGLLVYAFKSPVGLVCMVIIPCVIIIVFEVLRLARVFGKEKKEKQKAEQQKQADEIEELKRKLAQLESQKGTTTDDKTPESQSDEPKAETQEETPSESVGSPKTEEQSKDFDSQNAEKQSEAEQNAEN